MRCPFCHSPNSRVVDSRSIDNGKIIRRRRECLSCGKRFTTHETAILNVIKRSGLSEPFSRDKVLRGVRRACQGRDVSEDELKLLVEKVGANVRSTGASEIPSNEVGLAILGPLRELDEVAYLRFASVYKSFTSLEDFEKEMASLRHDHEHTEADNAGYEDL